MNYENINKLNIPDEPSNEELREIEEHLDEYIEDQNHSIIILTIIKTSNTFITKSALISD